MAKSHAENKPEPDAEDKRHLKKIARRYSFTLANVTEEQIRLYLLKIKNYERFAYLI